MTVPEKLIGAFWEIHRRAPALIVRAPGRVNLIGEHTDYNGGLVLPMAIERAVWIALEPTNDPTVEIYSLEFLESRHFLLGQFVKEEMSWIEYIKGVAWALMDAGRQLTGFRGVMTGDVPLGAGLSSSAALECAVGTAFSEVNHLRLEPKQLALLAQRAENAWVGVQCGIMDQMISAAGEKEKAIMLDCRTFEITPVQLPPETRVAILDTNTRRGLESSAYNERRTQCETGAAAVGADSLGEIEMSLLEKHRDHLDHVTYRRCRHVITECRRVRDAVYALKSGDSQRFGSLMNESHESLRNDFEVSSPELDVIQRIAVRQAGCNGARMTGAGFGGCAVALIHEDTMDRFSEAVIADYQRETGLEPAVYITRAGPGAGIVDYSDPSTSRNIALSDRKEKGF